MLKLNLHILPCRIIKLNHPLYSSSCHSCKRSCWKCGKFISSPSVFCNTHCGAIQPLQDSSAHSPGILLLENYHTFDINLQSLKSKYLHLQRIVHPDKFSQTSSLEKQYADQQSTHLNKLYYTLKDPLTRSLYLLSLNNINVDENMASSDPQLLETVMDAWEHAQDVSDDSMLNQLNLQNQSRIQTSISKISQAFKNKDFKSAKDFTIELKYWYSLRDFLNK